MFKLKKCCWGRLYSQWAGLWIWPTWVGGGAAGHFENPRVLNTGYVLAKIQFGLNDPDSINSSSPYIDLTYPNLVWWSGHRKGGLHGIIPIFMVQGPSKYQHLRIISTRDTPVLDTLLMSRSNDPMSHNHNRPTAMAYWPIMHNWPTTTPQQTHYPKPSPPQGPQEATHTPTLPMFYLPLPLQTPQHTVPYHLHLLFDCHFWLFVVF
jgi:hypothetical protein